MPRSARLNLPGGVFHLVSRFAGDEWWLDRTGAREAYLESLGKAALATDVVVLAYCLMSNHVHLVIVQGEAPLERFTKSLHTGFARFAQRAPRRRKPIGAVFAGRPRSTLVERERYLPELVRYVHNNPVRAGVARFARSSPWSSHRAYIGRADAPDWLRVDEVLEAFGLSARARARFDAFVDAGRGEDRRPELSGAASASEAAAVRRRLGDAQRVSDGILGGDAFIARVRAERARVAVAAARSSRGGERRAGAVARPSVRAVVEAVLECTQLDPAELAERPRSRASADAKRLATWVWLREYKGQQVDIARALELDTSVVSRHYGQALKAARELDERAKRVTALLAKRRKPRA